MVKVGAMAYGRFCEVARMIKFVILNMRSNWPTPVSVRNSERTGFENIRIGSDCPVQTGDRLARKPPRPVASRARPRALDFIISSVRGDDSGNDDARRSNPRPHLVQGRRQGLVRQGTGGGDGRGPRRPGRALPEGYADGAAARFRHGGRAGARG